MSYELDLGPERPSFNLRNGQFLKGHVPANKGRSWSEWMPKRSQRRAAKGWKNIRKHPGRNHPNVIEKLRKKLVVVTDDGKFRIFEDSVAATAWLGKGDRSDICRCARCNMSKKVCKRDWRPGQPKGASRVNTDHKYHGYRWYFYDDPDWWEKVG